MLESNQDKIKLAEAMDLIVAPISLEDVGGPFLVTTDSAQTTSDQLVAEWVEFEPFTDANDDYAVLEWIRSQGVIGSWIATQLGKDNKWSIDYKIGDYARAALKVIERV